MPGGPVVGRSGCRIHTGSPPTPLQRSRRGAPPVGCETGGRLLPRPGTTAAPLAVTPGRGCCPSQGPPPCPGKHREADALRRAGRRVRLEPRRCRTHAASTPAGGPEAAATPSGCEAVRVGSLPPRWVSQPHPSRHYAVMTRLSGHAKGRRRQEAPKATGKSGPSTMTRCRGHLRRRLPVPAHTPTSRREPNPRLCHDPVDS
jgi:hypothetical protein